MRVLTFGFFLSILYFQIYCVQCKIKTEDEECEKYCKTLNGFITKHCGIICLTYGSAETRYCVLACSMKAHSVNAFYKCVDPCYHEPKSNATCEEYCRQFYQPPQSNICPDVCHENWESNIHSCKTFQIIL
uniref:Uncharacterized protein n=1 Tax=Trichobilharzia regenti TaxID=157069 RepID=A0AA85KC65_TRIRE|nr:unnamed protein product [Trichobilharzia regenti]